MAKKFIDIMDTTFRDGFQSVFGGRVLMEDFFPAVEAAANAGIKHFEFNGGGRFQSSIFYLQENTFDMMDKFRSIVGPEANLQTLSRGINTVTLDTGSREIIDLHAKLFAKHGTTTIRNFDALNDVKNLEYSAQCIKKYGLNHEAVVSMIDLSSNSDEIAFYEKTLRDILDSGLPFDSICFKDAGGIVTPTQIHKIIKMARKILGDDRHIRLHTHETAGMSVASYLAALEAGVDGIDLAASPVSSGVSQPDILTLLHATKGSDFDLGGLEASKILSYEETLKDCLSDYVITPEVATVSPIIPFSHLSGAALSANIQMMREDNTLDKLPEVINAMEEVVQKSGFGTRATPISQFYWQQAYANVMFGPWEQISSGYGKMILGYFGSTPATPDKEILNLASEKLNLEPTNGNPLDFADKDPKKSLDVWKERLEIEELDTTEENIFIAITCEEKGIAFLKGESPLSVRKKSEEETEKKGNNTMADGNYTVVVDGKKFSVQVAQGDVDIQVAPAATPAPAVQAPVATPAAETVAVPDPSNSGGTEVGASVNGNVWKILVDVGDKVEKGQVVSILEAMKMEIDIESPCSGTVNAISVKPNDAVEEGQTIMVIG